MDVNSTARIALLVCVALLAEIAETSRCQAQAGRTQGARSSLAFASSDVSPSSAAAALTAPAKPTLFHAPGGDSRTAFATDSANASLPSGGRASLTVVSNSDQRGALTPDNRPLLQDGDVTPARYGQGSGSGAHRRRPTWSNRAEAQQPSGNRSSIRFTRPAGAIPPPPRRESPTKGRRSELIVRASDAEDGFPSTQDPQQAVRTRLITASDRREEASTGASPGMASSELLLKAHELSQSADGESDYSEIIQLCAKAADLGVASDAASFARSLSAWALNRRGQLRNDEGQFELAMADFQAALEADPNNWRALHNRGVTFAQNGDFASAFDDFSRVIQLSPKFPKAYSNRATLYVQAGKVEDALADFEQALELDPDLFAAHVGRGRICHQTGRLEEAIAHLDRAIEIDGERCEVVCSRADLHADLGNYGEALRDYARAIQLKPDFAHAYRNGAWLLATCPDERFRDAENALAGAEQALSYGYGQRHAALDTLAAALANAGRFEDAVGTLQQAIEVAPEEARSAYHVRLQLYEARRPFRISPVDATARY